jgi:hypothetical protein
LPSLRSDPTGLLRITLPEVGWQRFPRAFDLLILDESHALRNLFGTQKPPQVALEFEKLLRDDTSYHKFPIFPFASRAFVMIREI